MAHTQPWAGLRSAPRGCRHRAGQRLLVTPSLPRCSLGKNRGFGASPMNILHLSPVPDPPRGLWPLFPARCPELGREGRGFVGLKRCPSVGADSDPVPPPPPAKPSRNGFKTRRNEQLLWPPREQGLCQGLGWAGHGGHCQHWGHPGVGTLGPRPFLDTRLPQSLARQG